MFELSISTDKRSPFLSSPLKKRGYNPAIHETFIFEDEAIKICGLKYKDSKICTYEDSSSLILISGVAFPCLFYSKALNPLSAKEIHEIYIKEGTACFQKIKGNFVILIYNKLNFSFLIAKDQLGLKFLYYKNDKNNFYASTNLNDFKQLDYSYDYVTILEKILFTYPIGRESYIKEVFMLNGGEFLHFERFQLTKVKYFQIEDLIPKNKEQTKFDNQQFLEMFELSLLQRTKTCDKLNVSLTGGFDGRANAAVLLKNQIPFKAYSFGKKDGENTSVPIDVANKLRLDYSPIFLDEIYEKEYPNCAKDAILFSDGISIFERANYIFALKILVKYSNYNITGLLGGEILGIVNEIVDFINQAYFDLIYAENRFDIEKILKGQNIYQFINSDFIRDENIVEQLIDRIKVRRNLIDIWRSQKFGWMHYLFDLMNIGFQRFYGNQMHLERYYSENLTPYYDFDLLSYLFSSDHINIYKNTFNTSPFVRRNNRKLQCLIIKSFFPQLGEILVDRGYPPNYLLDLRKIIIPYIFYRRKRESKNIRPDFTSPIWCEMFFKTMDFGEHLAHNKLFLYDRIEDYIKSYEPEKYNKNFNHLFSIVSWMKYN